MLSQNNIKLFQIFFVELKNTSDFDFDHWQCRKINNFEVTKMSKARLETNSWHTCVLFTIIYVI